MCELKWYVYITNYINIVNGTEKEGTLVCELKWYVYITNYINIVNGIEKEGTLVCELNLNEDDMYLLPTAEIIIILLNEMCFFFLNELWEMIW